jgi:phosphatidylglycerol lysyltransferase
VTRPRFTWRRGLFVLLAIALLAVVAAQFASGQELWADLSQADWGWAAAALVLQAAFFLLYGGLYRWVFRAVGVTSRALDLVPVLLASIFAKTAVPFTAAPAAAVFIDDAAARGESGPRTAVGVVVVLVVDLLTALPFVAAGTIALILRDRLVEFALAGSGLFVAFIVAIVVGLVLAARRPGWLEALLTGCRAVVNRSLRLLGRPALLPDGWARRTTDQLAAAVRSIPGHPRDIAIASGYGLLVHLANIAGLAAVFLAFGQRLDPAALAAGFGMSIVFFMIAIVPDGIGAVEGAMALVFVQLGMTPAAAILVTVAYRVLNVWLPVAIGFWCARRLRLFGAGEGAWAPSPVSEPESP